MRREDEAAVRAFVESQGRPLLRTAVALTGDRPAAQDLVQEALIRVALRWRSLQGDPAAYAHRVLVNLAVDGWRARRRRPELLVEDGDARLDGAVPAQAGAVDARLDLLALLAELPPRQRAVVVLRYVEDRSEAEVADLLDLSVGAVKSAASRGMASLRARAATIHDLEESR